MSPTEPKRRWYQFSLRTLLLFVLLCAVLCSWCAVKMQQVRKQREAVAAIVKAGGEVHYDYEQYISPSNRGAPSPEALAPAWLLKLLGVDFFADVKTVDSLNREFGDRDTMHLRELRNVETLYLNGPQITDAGLEDLKGLTKLETLYLNNTQITDAGLEHLTGLTKLCALQLNNTQITDAGLGHLKGLTNLEVLSLAKTHVTDEGVKQFQKALPNCTIFR